MNIPLQSLVAQAAAASPAAGLPQNLSIQVGHSSAAGDLADAIVPVALFLCIFVYMIYRVIQDRKVELALIEKGESDLVLKLRGQKKPGNPWLYVGIGVAAVLSSIVLWLAKGYADTAIWFFVCGLFFIIGGLFAQYGRRLQEERNTHNAAG